MSEIIYPQIPHDEKKSVKLKYSDIEKIKHLYHVEKWTILEISEKFEVVPSSIRYHLDDEYKRKAKLASKKCKNEYMKDEKYKKSIVRKLSEWTKNREKTDKNFHIYYNSLRVKNQMNWAKRNKKKTQIHMQNYYVNKITKQRAIRYAMRWFDA